MKHWLALAALICFGSARANAQAITYTAPPSTATTSGVFISSVAPTRVDYLNNGATGYVLANRTAIVLSIPSAGKAICDFDAVVSTIQPTLAAASPNYGLEYGPGIYTIPLPSNLAYYCMSPSTSAGQAAAVHQTSPFKPGTRSIPGSP